MSLHGLGWFPAEASAFLDTQLMFSLSHSSHRAPNVEGAFCILQERDTVGSASEFSGCSAEGFLQGRLWVLRDVTVAMLALCVLLPSPHVRVESVLKSSLILANVRCRRACADLGIFRTKWVKVTKNCLDGPR